VAAHAAGDGMNRVLHVDAPLDQQRRQFRDPDVPSSEPVMIWILFINTKPIAAPATPGYEFSFNRASERT
jgi:hypothetical protein